MAKKAKEISLDDLIGSEETKLKQPKQTKGVEMTKSPKTIKVSTLIISIAVVVALVLSFIAGVKVANSYNDNIEALATAKAQKIVETSKPQQ